MVIAHLRKHFFLYAALLTALVSYSGSVSCPSGRYFCFPVFERNVTFLSGKIISTPAFFRGKKNHYSFRFSCVEAEGKGGLKANGRGIVNIIVPEDLFQSFMPGKLYTGAEKGFLPEEGALCTLKVSPAGEEGGHEFSCLSVENLHYENWFGRFRALCRLQFKRLMYSWGKAGGFFLALLSGSKEYVEPEILEGFRKCGLSHILALSGMHLSLFSTLALRLGKRTFGKGSGMFFQVVAVLLFVWFAGASPSLVRALFCSLISIFLILIKYKNHSMLNVLCISFLLHAGLFPWDLETLSFMLSYGALFGILMLNDISGKFFCRASPKGFSDGLSQGFSAQLFTMPVGLKYFGYLTPGGIISSVVVSPVVTIFIYTGLFIFLMSLLCPFLAFPGSLVMKGIYSVILYAVSFFKIIPKIQV